MPISADVAARALTDTWQHLSAATTDGWSCRERGALAVVTRVPLATLNGVLVDETDANPEIVAALLGEVAATGLPYCLQVRPGCDPLMAELALSRGMIGTADIPLMALEDPSALDVAESGDLVIRTVPAEHADLHVSVAAAGFEAPERLFSQLMTPGVVGARGASCYLGEAGGAPVTTGFAVTLRDFVGIFNVATPPRYRRRGYGAAITARAVCDAFSSGARWAWLQSSPAGYRVYEKLGFRTVEPWQCWTMTGSNDQPPATPRGGPPR